MRYDPVPVYYCIVHDGVAEYEATACDLIIDQEESPCDLLGLGDNPYPGDA